MGSPNDFQLPRESGAALKLIMNDPQFIAQVITQVQKNTMGITRITPPTARNFADIMPTGSPDNRLDTIPLQFTQQIASPAAYTAAAGSAVYSQAEMTAVKTALADAITQLRLVMDQFTKSNINPGGGV